jgi:UDP-2,3-diacylglucosamine pyrophosphatase LpxH
MNYIKKHAPEIIALVGAFFVIAFFIWALSQHAITGLIRVNGFFKLVFLIFGVIGLILIAAGLYYLWIKTKKNISGIRWLSVLLIILSLPAIIVPPLAFSVLGGIFSPAFIDTPPRLMMTGDSGDYGIPDMAVYFTTGEAVSDYTLTWGDDNGNTTLTENKDTNQHLFILNDLKPDTRYYYQIDGGQIAYFSTPSIDGQIRIAVASDAHYGSGNAKNDLTAEMLSEIADPANGFDMFFFIGDLVEYGFIDNQWEEAFSSFNTATSVIPTRYATGNHDTLFSGLGNYLNYCVPEGLDEDADARLWYRIDIGSIHILVLDVEWSAETYTKAQAEWLEQQLQSIPEDDWTIVLSHGFYYACGQYSNMWKWYDNEETISKITPLFNEYKVDLVCSGHVHNLGLLEANGVKYAVCGAFGGLPEPEPVYISPFSLWSTSSQYAFIDIAIDNDECTLTFRDYNLEALYAITFEKNR